MQNRRRETMKKLRGCKIGKSIADAVVVAIAAATVTVVVVVVVIGGGVEGENQSSLLLPLLSLPLGRC